MLLLIKGLKPFYSIPLPYIYPVTINYFKGKDHDPIIHILKNVVNKNVVYTIISICFINQFNFYLQIKFYYV